MPTTWKHSLARLLKQATAETGHPPRVAILGIGNTLRSDDAAGVLVARALSAQLPARHEHILVLEAGSAPENCTAEIRQFAPDLVLFVDAAEMRETPGAIRWICEEAIDGLSASTHGLPLPILARFLALDLGCQVAILGIQPASNPVGENISAEVLRAVEEVVSGLLDVVAQVQSEIPT